MAFADAGARMTCRATRAARVALALLLTAALGGCATGGGKKPPVGTPEPDKFLFDRGSEALTKHRWTVAREYFRQLVDSYPQSTYRADGKLGIGDTYMGEGSAESYVLAINEFHEFLSFYPTHDRAYYAQYQLAMAHFKQMRAAARDQTETRDAVRELQTFVDKYGNTPLGDAGRKSLREAKDRVADAELSVGEQYYKLKWYPGAVGRLEPLIKSDPTYTNRDAAFFYLAESYVKLNQPALALPMYERLVKEFERSDYLDRAKQRIEELKQTVASPKAGDTR